MIAVLTWHGFHFGSVDGSVVSYILFAFLNILKRHLHKMPLMMWDALHAHKNQKSRQLFAGQHVRIVPASLPSHPLERSPVEGIWGYLRTSLPICFR